MIRRPLLIVGICISLGAAVYFGAAHTTAGRSADLNVLEGFMGLWQLPFAGQLVRAPSLFNLTPYVLLVSGIFAIGLLRGRPRLGFVAAAMMVCASASSQILKPLLAVQRDHPWWHWMDAASWPSGHSTNAMVFALALAMVVPPRLRAAAMVFGGLLTIVTVYALLVLGSHYPSDVLGGLLLATAWRALATIPLRSEVTVNLRAPALAGAVFAACVAGLVAARPGEAATYAADHTTFVAGALAIAAAALVLSGSVLVPTAARPGPPPG